MDHPDVNSPHAAGNFVKNTLFMMTYQTDQALWAEVEVDGEIPKGRYGHTLNFASPHLILFGGNTETQAVNEVWCLGTKGPKPNRWIQLSFQGELPSPRCSHSTALCTRGNSNGMLVVFGGRNTENKLLNDSWGTSG